MAIFWKQRVTSPQRSTAAAAVCGLLALMITESTATMMRYDGYQVFRITPKTHSDVMELHVFLLAFHIDVWREPRKDADFFEVMASPKQADLLKRALHVLNLTVEVIVPNVESLVQGNSSTIKIQSPNFNWLDYYPLDSIHDWLREQARQRSSVASLVIAGNSSEGRPLLGLRVAHGANKPIVVIEGGMHAREWISPATVMWFAKEALTGSSAIVRSYEWHLFPVVNPDGYVYSFTHNRFWRKNRGFKSPYCVGVDMNRNFPFRWQYESNTYQCTETYSGPSPASEPETKALVSYIRSIASRTRIYVTLHSYGQYILYPWGFTFSPPYNEQRFSDIAAKAVRKLQARHGTPYSYGQISTRLYRVAGSSVDFAHSLNIPYAFAFELRGDSNRGGFLLPRSEIIPTADEALDAVTVILEEAIKT